MNQDIPLLNAGVIGAGWVATARHIPALQRDRRVRLAAIYDKDPRRAQAVADRLHIPVATSDLDTLFAAAPDFVSICTPPLTHAPLSLQALAAGRHVLVEKPMAMNVREAKSMIAAAEKAGKRLCVCHNLLYARSVRKALEQLKDAGPLQHVVATQLSSPRRRLPTWYGSLPGGLFFDESPHILYLLRRLLGDFQVDKVRVRFEAEDENAIDFLDAQISAGKISANLTMAFNAPVSEWGLTIIAARKIVSINLFRDIVTVAESDGRHGPSEVLLGSMGVALQAATGFISSGALYATNRLLYGHERLISAFVDNLLGGPAAVGLEDALAVVASTQAILSKAGLVARTPSRVVA